MVDLEKFVLHFVSSIEHTLTDPVEAIEFIVRVAKGANKAGEAELSDSAIEFLERAAAGGEEKARGIGQEFLEAAGSADPSGAPSAAPSATPSEAPSEQLIRGIEDRGIDLPEADEVSASESLKAVSPYLAELKSLLAKLNTLDELRQKPHPGPGRDDPWGIIRNTVYQDPTPLTAPTSIPHLFHTGDVDWFHADGNTDSLLDRNIAQGLALGGKVNSETKVASLVV